jgi:nicotinamide-nucleotide amidase
MTNAKIADRAIAALAVRSAAAIAARGWRVATAESCTGGWIAKALTDVPGSSKWFEGGVVSYSNALKTALLGVPAALLNEHGAVSEAAVRAMVEGARTRLGVQVAVAVSGVAGPDGGTADKPVGTVWLAWAAERGTSAELHRFDGDRDAVRRASVARALERLIELAAAP